MKTLIITGTYQTELMPKNGVRYIVTLYGQSPESPEVQYITSFNEVLSGYNSLQEFSRAKYAEYFKTDLFNIISLENLQRV
jgi:hypothetical protein